MLKKRIYQGLSAALLALAVGACKMPELATKAAGRPVPTSYAAAAQDSANTAQAQWKQFFTDPNLVGLIDTALQRNQELNISLQEIQIARNEIQIRKGEYLPFVGAGREGRNVSGPAATRSRALRRKLFPFSPSTATLTRSPTTSSAHLPAGKWISGTSCATPASRPRCATWLPWRAATSP